MSENNRTNIDWLHPEILMGLPGDFIVGYFLATWALVIPVVSAFTVVAGIFWLICISALACVRDRNDIFPIFAGLYRVSAVVLGCSFAPLGPTTWLAVAAGVLLSFYAYGCSKIVSIGQGEEPVFPGKKLLWIIGSGSLFCVGSLFVGFWNHGLSLLLLLVCWFIIWLMSRTIYFCNALKGYNSPERLRQGGGLFLRGIILLQGAAAVAVLPDNYSWAGAIAAFILVTAQTMICRVVDN